MRLAFIKDDFDGERGIVVEFPFEFVKQKIVEAVGEEAGPVLDKLVDQLKIELTTT